MEKMYAVIQGKLHIPDVDWVYEEELRVLYKTEAEALAFIKEKMNCEQTSGIWHMEGVKDIYGEYIQEFSMFIRPIIIGEDQEEA